MTYRIHIDEVSQRRLEAAARELGRKVEDLIEAAAEESALNFFRHRKDDPGRETP